MSDVQTIMKFEFLPNEILLQYFLYLNGSDIFYSFDQLNYRFYKLIRNISLYLDFTQIQKTRFVQFCLKILLSPGIKEQIYSLHLSNNITHDQIAIFLSFFSFDEFPNLQLLSLIKIRQDNVEKLNMMLPLIPQLSSLHLIESSGVSEKIVTTILMSKLRTLSLPQFWLDLEPDDTIGSITNLTLSYELLDTLYQVLQNLPMLKYLNCSSIADYSFGQNTRIDLGDYRSVHLKQLVMVNFECCFNDLEMFIKHTPCLRSLAISGRCGDKDMIDAYQWEHLITSSLPQLTIFKFNFSCFYEDDVLQKFEQFQSNFWHEQRHWYTEYEQFENSAQIFTVPYISNTYIITGNLIRHSTKLVNQFNIFDNVTHIKIVGSRLTEKCQYHFSNVTSLTLHLATFDNRLPKEYIESLKMFVNISNLKHLDILGGFRMHGSVFILEILKEAANISSIGVSLNTLESFLSNDNLQKYLNKMIRKLNIGGTNDYMFSEPDKMEQFCEIFSNIEELKCDFKQPNDLLFLLTRLPRLSIIDADRLLFSECSSSWLKEEAKKLKITLHIEHNHHNRISVCIWVDRHMNC